MTSLPGIPGTVAGADRGAIRRRVAPLGLPGEVVAGPAHVGRPATV